MKTVYELIETISKRTAMYTGECKLSNIRSFIDGYAFSINDEKAQIKFLSTYPNFHNWVAEKFGFYESTVGWQNMILAIEMGISPKGIKWEHYSKNATVADHESSVNKFFSLVEEYKINA